MKIAFTSEHFYPYIGGAEQSLMELAKYLVRRGHDVSVYTAGDGEKSVIDGVKVKRIFHCLKKWTHKGEVLFPKHVDKEEGKIFLDEIKDEKFDILHSNNRDTAVFTSVTGAKAGVPAITHIRDYWPICPKRDFHKDGDICTAPEKCWACMSKYYKSWYKSPYYWKSYRDTKYRFNSVKKHSSHFVYNSRYVRDRIGLQPGGVIYNPVNVEVPDNKPKSGKILFIGNVTKRKGIIELSRAVRSNKLSKLELHIIGDGYLFEGIKGRNIFKHSRLEYDQVKDHLSNAEMLVVPSLWPEPFGRVAAEGMAAGLPVISSSYGGLKEVVGNAGILLRDVNEKGLRDAILRLHNNPSLRKELGERGKQRVKMFSPENIADQMIKLYKKILKSKKE